MLTDAWLVLGFWKEFPLVFMVGTEVNRDVLLESVMAKRQAMMAKLVFGLIEIKNNGGVVRLFYRI